jgi:hypothetical protein
MDVGLLIPRIDDVGNLSSYLERVPAAGHHILEINPLYTTYSPEYSFRALTNTSPVHRIKA